MALDNRKFGVLLAGLDSSDAERLLAALDARPEEFEITAADDTAAILDRIWDGRAHSVVAAIRPADPHMLELLIGGLSLSPRIQFLLIPPRGSAGYSSAPAGSGGVYLLPQPLDVNLSARLIVGAAELRQQFQADRDGGPTPAHLFAAVQDGHDECWVRIIHPSGETGDLCLRQGHVIFSEQGRLAGDEAVQAILSWDRCSYEYHPLPSAVRSNTNKPLRSLLTGPRRPVSASSLESDQMLEPDPPAFAVTDDLPDPDPPAFAHATCSLEAPDLESPEPPTFTDREDAASAEVARTEEPPPSASGFAEEVRSKLTDAIEGLRNRSAHIAAAALLLPGSGSVEASFHREGVPPMDCKEISGLYSEYRALLDRRGLGDGVNLMLTAKDGAIVLLPLCPPGWILGVHVKGAFALAARAITACAEELRRHIAGVKTP